MKSGKLAAEEAEKASVEKERAMQTLPGSSSFHMSARTDSQASKAFGRVANLRRKMNSVGLNKNLSTTSTGLPEQDEERNLRTAINAVRRGLDYKKKELQLQTFGLPEPEDGNYQTGSELSENPSAVSFQKGV